MNESWSRGVAVIIVTVVGGALCLAWVSLLIAFPLWLTWKLIGL